MASRYEPVWTRAESGSPSGASSARSSSSGPAYAPNTFTATGGAVISRLAASASGASGAHACQAAIVAAASGQNVSNTVVSGARHGREVQRRDDAEVPAARAAQRPEQVGLLVLVAAHLAPVGQDHLGCAQRVGGQPVEAAEEPEPAAQREAGDADGRAAPGRDRHAVSVELVVDVAEQRARPDRRPPVGDRHAVERRDVDQHAVRRGAAAEAVPAAARRDRQSVRRGMLEGGSDVAWIAARDDRLGLDVSEAGERWSHPR